ncbi:MAG: methyl-accepting chemotaxis protein [Treponema sp.]|nr:methyl-accepting chemotaxis protein [Treponema sp.]
MNIFYFKNLKIITKLTISTLVFLLPLGIMLYSIISMSMVSINKDQNELNGIDVLRPAIELMQIIPLYVFNSPDAVNEEQESAIEKAKITLSVLKEKYSKHFSGSDFMAFPLSLTENWEQFSISSDRDIILWSYRQIMHDLHILIVYVGDVSGLITFDRLSYFAESADNSINVPVIDEQQLSSLDRLETILKNRISFYRLRLILSLAAAVFSAIIAFVIILITTLSIKNSTLNLSYLFKQLDKNDLSVRIEPKYKDELGEFINALSSFLMKLNSSFSSVNENASMVSLSVLELSASAKEMSATANEQSASVAEIVTTMESNKDLSAQSAEKTTVVAELAVQTQELSRRGADIRNANEEMMLNIRNQNTKIIEIIKNLTDMLSRIDESILLIDTIADHTKLIAFNAALEASSSGEAGMRFSVVAGEIRRFADNVVESASEIKEKISELNEAAHMLLTEANTGSNIIDSGYNKMVEQKEVFENIVEVSKNVAEHSQQISSLSKQQERASNQVFSALKEISGGVNQFGSAVKLTSATVDKLNNITKDLKEMLAKYNITTRRDI